MMRKYGVWIGLVVALLIGLPVLLLGNESLGFALVLIGSVVLAVFGKGGRGYGGDGGGDSGGVG